MVRADLAVAGVPFVAEWRDGLRRADFHSLRHTFGRRLKRAGVPLDQAMQLMRHSDPKLTAAVYGRSSDADLADALGKLPPVACGLACSPLAVSGDTAGDSAGQTAPPDRGTTSTPETTQPPSVTGVDAEKDSVILAGTSAPFRTRT